MKKKKSAKVRSLQKSMRKMIPKPDGGTFGTDLDDSAPAFIDIDAEDLSASLTSLGTVVEVSKPPKSFFHRTLDFNPFVSYRDERVKRGGPLREKAKLKAVNYFEIPQEYQQHFLDTLSVREETVKDFLLKEYSTANIALDSGLDRAVEHLKQLIPKNEVHANFTVGRQLVSAALNIRLLRKMAEIIGINEDDVQSIIKAYLSQSNFPFILRRESTSPAGPAGAVVRRTPGSK